MSTNENIVKETIPFTQNELELEVKRLLLSKGLTDILYPGSTVSQLSDVMTYLVHALNTNTAINLQEVILPLASKRMNVLFGARQLGYEAVQKTSYRYKLKAQIREQLDENGDPLLGDFRVQIPKYTEFTSNGNTYYYLGEDIDVVTNNQERFGIEIELEVKEGKLIRYDDNELLRFRAFNVVDKNGDIVTKQNYLIPFRDIEENGLEVFLTYVDKYGTTVEKELWTKSDQFLIDSSFDYQKRKYIRLENFFLQFPSIFFEIGGYGNPIRLNTLIEVNALISKGADGKAGDVFEVVDPLLKEQISVSPGVIVHYGSNEEHIESIKENAPIFHNTANRAVTALDYVALSQRHEAVKLASVWGGEDEVSNRFANVLFSFTPERTQRVFLSTDPNKDYNLPDENYALNVQYDLQYLPRRPKIPDIQDPNAFGVPPKPTNPDWIPLPSNYMEKPDTWVTGLTAEPTPVVNPGAGPQFTWIPERDAYNHDSAYPNPFPNGLTFPTDWVENPNIDELYLSDPTNPDWATPEEKAVIKNQKQSQAYEIYKALSFEVDEFGNPLSTWTQELEDKDKEWFANGGAPIYRDYIRRQDAIDYIQWRRDTTIYEKYVKDKEEWDALVAQNKKYADYITSKEGIEYTNYWNSFSNYANTPAELQARQDADIAYNKYLEDLEIYNQNREAIDELIDNWYLDDVDDVYPITPPPLPPQRDTNVFTILNAYKIMTMKHSHRKPAYIDFFFNIKVLKYNLAVTNSKTNETIFNIIDEYFKNYAEKFEVEYFASNLQRRVDEALGDNSGVEINLKTQIAINEAMYDYKYSGTSKIIIRLAFPFENLYPDGLNMTNQQFLPNIDTLSFVGAVTDWRLKDGDSFSIGAGDSVLEKREVDGTGDNSDGIFGVKYISKIAQTLDSNTVNFLDKTKWKDLGGNYDYYFSAGDVVIQKGERIIIDVENTVNPSFATKGYVYTRLTNNTNNQPTDVINEDFNNETLWYKEKATAYDVVMDSTNLVDIKTGDTVFINEDLSGYGGNGILGSVYKSKKDFNDVTLNTVDYTNKDDWQEFIPVSKDLYCLKKVDNYGNLAYRVDQNPDPGAPGAFLPPTNELPNIILDVYLGDIKNDTLEPDANPDEKVGRYYIRNERFQHIDVHLDFNTGGGVGAPPDSVFTDYGYGHIDLVYPSNIDINSDNIPFTGYTIPRLRQVKFYKDV